MGFTDSPMGFNPVAPLNNVAPLSYRDGTTLLEMLQQLRDYINRILLPLLDEQSAEMVKNLNKILDEYKTWMEAKGAELDGKYDAFDAEMQGKYNTFVEQITQLVTAINNRVGPASMVTIQLANNMRITPDPTWPTQHAVMLRLIQPAGGPATGVAWDTSIDPGVAVNINPDQDTYVQLLPVNPPIGAVKWRIQTVNPLNPQMIWDRFVALMILNFPTSEIRKALDGRYNQRTVHVLPLLGQSNMSGRGIVTNTSLTDPVQPRIFQYGSKVRTLRAASEPLDMHDSPAGIGPGMQIARNMLEHIHDDDMIVLVPTAHGGTELCSDNTLAWRWGVAGNLTAQAMTQIDAAVAAAQAQWPGAAVVVRAIFWHQGEQDGFNNVTDTQYQTDLEALITGLRGKYGADVPFIMGQMVPAGLRRDLIPGTRDLINWAQTRVAVKLPRVGFAAAPDDQNGDNTHFNAVGQRKLGASMYQEFVKARAGIAPTTSITPPPNTQLITDSFDRVDGPVGFTPSGQAWLGQELNGGTPIQAEIISNTLGHKATTGSWSYWTIDTGARDYAVETKVGFQNSDRTSPFIVKYLDAKNWVGLYLNQAGGVNRYRISGLSAGVTIKEVISQVPQNSGDLLRARVDGDQVTVWAGTDGNTLIGTVTLTGTVANGTRVGFGFHPTSKNTWDYINVTAIVKSDKLSDLIDSKIAPLVQGNKTDWYPLASQLRANPGYLLNVPTHVTPSGGECTHPSVVKLDTPISGYQYWMAFTPYPAGNDAHEDPNIVASVDGINWVVPAGLVNPLDDAPGSPTYNSDTDLVYADGKFWCFWRYTNTAGGAGSCTIYVRTSTDGITWTPKEVVYQTDRNAVDLASPSFIFDGSKWTMYATDLVAAPKRILRFQTTGKIPLLGQWGAQTVVSVPAVNLSESWHLEVRFIEGVWLMLLNTSLTGLSGAGGNLYFRASRDGVNFIGNSYRVVNANSNQITQLYRATFTVEMIGGRSLVRIWYSGQNSGTPRRWSMFHTVADFGADNGPFAQAAGTIPAQTIAAGSNVTVDVDFPPGRFTVPPIVQMTLSDGIRDVNVAATAVSSTVFRANFGSTSNGERVAGARWTAVQMNPDGAVG